MSARTRGRDGIRRSGSLACDNEHVRRIVNVIVEKWRRAGLLGLALACSVISGSFLVLRDYEPMPYAWPLLFAVAAVSLMIFVIRPESHWLYRLSGSFVVCAFAATPISLFTRWAAGDLLGGRAVIGFVLYGMCATFLGVFWLRQVGPWQLRHEAETISKGD